MQRIPITVKLSIIFAILSAGIFFISALAYQNTGSMKKGFDTVYFGNIIPATHLQKIADMYRENITTMLLKHQNGIAARDEVVVSIKEAKRVITQSWKAYKSTYHSEEETRVIEYAESRLRDSAHLIELILYAYKRNDTRSLNLLIQNQLFPAIEPAVEILNKLIEYEFELARDQKRVANELYEQTTHKLIIALSLVFAIALMISIPIMHIVHNDQKRLQSMNEDLAQISITDPMTGLYNRRYFDMIFEREHSRSIREKKPLIFAMFDIDHFKQYNDTYGHDRGDEVIKSVANVFTHHLRRGGDFAFRLGGEEFGVLISGMPSEKAERLFNTIRLVIEKKRIPHKNSSVTDVVTLSGGYYVTTGEEETQSIYKAADKALYVAKDSGRNCIVSA